MASPHKNSYHNNLVMAVLLISSSVGAAEEESLGGQLLQTTMFQDVLRLCGLPMGLFPQCISDFTIEATGAFRLRLQSSSPCDSVFETRLRYDPEVSGRISYGKISDVRGVSAQELFLWLAVKGIRVDIPSSGLIYFEVELVSKQFSLSLFETPKECRSVPYQELKNDVHHHFPTEKDDVVLSAPVDRLPDPISEVRLYNLPFLSR